MKTSALNDGRPTKEKEYNQKILELYIMCNFT